MPKTKAKTEALPKFGEFVTESVLIPEIIVDQKYQYRVACDPSIVENYSLLIADGEQFPNIVLFKINDPDSEIFGKLVLVAGFQRLSAYEINDYRKVTCDIYEGTENEASLFAMNSNSRHGAAYTHADKNRVVKAAFSHPILMKLSDNKIAQYLGVSQGFVSRMHKEWEEEQGIQGESRLVETTTSDGRSYQIDTKKGAKTRAENKAKSVLELHISEEEVEEDLESEEELEEASVKEKYVIPESQLLISNEDIYIKTGQTYGSPSSKVSLGKPKDILKFPDEYDLTIYAGDLNWLIKNQALISKHSNLVLQCITGDDLTQTENLDTLASSFNIFMVNGEPFVTAYYCSKNIQIPDRTYSDHGLYIAELIKPYVSSKGSVLIIDPIEPVIEVVNSIDRKCQVFYTEPMIDNAHRELAIAKLIGLDLQLLT